MIRSLIAIALWSITSAEAAPRSEELMWSGRMTEAVAAVREELESRPKDVAAHERYIDLLVNLGVPGFALETYRQNLADHPNDPDAHYLIGRALPDPDLASKAYNNALALQPEHARAQMGLGAVFRATGKTAEAETAYTKAVKADPSLMEAWAGLWQTQDSSNRRIDAIATARSALKANPLAAEPYLALAYFVPEEASAMLLQGQKAVPKDPRLPAALAEEHLNAGNGPAAERAARQALALAPEEKSYQKLSFYAKALIDGTLDAAGLAAVKDQDQLTNTDPRSAELRYQALIDRYPKSVLPYLGRARARIRQGDKKDAVTDLIEARKISDTDVEVQATLGLLLLDMGQTEDAKPLLSGAAAARPEDPSLAIAAAQAYSKGGNGIEARKRLSAAYTKWPYDARVALAFAQVVSELGGKEEAYTILKDTSARLPDGRVVIALVAAAKDTRRFKEAADLLDGLHRQTGNDTFKELADKLRAQAQ